MKKPNSNVLEFTTKFINSNFRIKVFGRTEDGKFIKRALKAGMDACRCALRRGLVVTLYAK